MRKIAFLLFVPFIFSCSGSSDRQITAYKMADEGLRKSTETISWQTQFLLQQLEGMANDRMMEVSAQYWLPKAKQAAELSKGMVQYIHQLKTELRNGAGANKLKDADWERDMHFSERLFESGGKGKELLCKLIGHTNELLQLDPKLKYTFGQKLTVTSKDREFSLADTALFAKTFFKNIPAIAANMLLSKFENNVRISEYSILTFCNSQVGTCADVIYPDIYGLLVEQNSNHLKTGSELIVTAALGCYTVEYDPKFNINGRCVKLSNGIAEYKIKVPAKPGNYSVPVNVEFTYWNHQRKTMRKTISYTVVE